MSRVEKCQEEFDKAKKAVDDYRVAGQKESERIKAENDARWVELEAIAKDAELRHTEKGRRVQYEDRGAKVEIKSGFDRQRHCIVTDILVIDRTPGKGRHFHILIDEFGNELHRHVKGK